jgi:hypothetical protein
LIFFGMLQAEDSRKYRPGKICLHGGEYGWGPSRELFDFDRLGLMKEGLQ